MTMEPVDPARDRFYCRFHMTDAEVQKRLYGCLVKTNPELKEDDIYRSRFSREFIAEYRKSDGTNVRIAVGIDNLKRYLGSTVLGFEKDGVFFLRRVSKYSQLSAYCSG